MAQIPLAGLKIRDVEWGATFPSLTNEALSGKDQFVAQAGAERVTAKGSFVPLIGQDASLPLKAFLARLRGSQNSFCIPACEARQHADFVLMGASEFIDKDASATISGRRIVKTGGTDGSYDTSAFSSPKAGGAVVLFRAGQRDKNLYAGLNTDPFTNSGSATIDHAVFFGASGYFQLFESGTGLAVNDLYYPDDVFMIAYRGTSVSYYRNGELLRTTTVSAGLSFGFDSSFASSGAALESAAHYILPSVAAGANQFTAYGLPASQAVALKAGWLATALYEGGGAQLVTVAFDTPSNASGQSVVTIEPAFRKVPLAIVTDLPFAEVKMTAPVTPWRVESGQIYSAGFEAKEKI